VSEPDNVGRVLSIEATGRWKRTRPTRSTSRCGRHDDRARASHARLRRHSEAHTLSTLFDP